MRNDIDEFLCFQKHIYEHANADPVEVIHNLVAKMVIQTAGINQSNPKHAWLYEVLEKAVSSKIRTRNEKYKIGDFVEALIENGSSRNQAIKFTADWLILSPTNVRKANEFTRSKAGAEIAAIVEIRNYSLAKLIEENAHRKVPMEHTKALSAFQALSGKLMPKMAA